MVIEVNEDNLHSAAFIYSTAWKHAYKGYCEPEFVERHDELYARGHMLKAMDSGRSYYMLVDKTPVGIVSVGDDVISDLYVLPTRLSLGYGTQLLKHAMMLCTRPTLWVREENIADHELYKRLGFVDTGRKKRIAGKIIEYEMTHAGKSE